MKKISVLMPAYNSEDYISAAIDSVLAQDYKNFELVIIEDSSTDSTRSIIDSYNDNRITCLYNEKNLGIVKTLNKGLDYIDLSSEYIIRMDSDDILETNKFSEQVDYMDNNLDVVLSGTLPRDFRDGQRDSGRVRRLPKNDKQIRSHLIFTSPFVHPSVIMRTSVINGENIRYLEKFKSVEDYELWARLAKKGRLYNIQKPLINYRLHADSITAQAVKKKEQRKSLLSNVRKKFLDSYHINLSSQQLSLLHDLVSLSYDLKNNQNNVVLKKAMDQIFSSIDLDYFDPKYIQHMFGTYFRLNISYSKINRKQLISILKTEFDFKIDLTNRILLRVRN